MNTGKDFAARMMSKVWREWAHGKKLNQTLPRATMYVGSVIWYDYKHGLKALTRFTRAVSQIGGDENSLMFKSMVVKFDRSAPGFHIRIEQD